MTKSAAAMKDETALRLWRDLQFGDAAQVERAQQLLKNAPDEVRAEVMRRASGGQFKKPRPKPPKATAPKKIRY